MEKCRKEIQSLKLKIDDMNLSSLNRAIMKAESRNTVQLIKIQT